MTAVHRAPIAAEGGGVADAVTQALRPLEGLDERLAALVRDAVQGERESTVGPDPAVCCALLQKPWLQLPHDIMRLFNVGQSTANSLERQSWFPEPVTLFGKLRVIRTSELVDNVLIAADKLK